MWQWLTNTVVLILITVVFSTYTSINASFDGVETKFDVVEAQVEKLNDRARDIEENLRAVVRDLSRRLKVIEKNTTKDPNFIPQELPPLQGSGKIFYDAVGAYGH